MRDIGSALTEVMREKQCSPTRALLYLCEKEKTTNGIYIHQSKPKKETCRRLRY